MSTNNPHTVHPQTGQPSLNSATSALPQVGSQSLPPPNLGWEVYFHASANKYYCKTATGYTPADYRTFQECLYPARGWQLCRPFDSDFALFVNELHSNYTVDFAGSLAGYKKGLLVQGDTRLLITSEPKFIRPRAGNCRMLRSVFARMFGAMQLTYFYGWIKMALHMFETQEWMAGQVLVLAGAPGAGKGLCGTILTQLFGGRTAGSPYAYMAGKTTFNGDFMSCELLTIDDQVSMTNIQARRDFGSKIKDFAVNKNRWLHGKYMEAKQVCVLQRLVITTNDQPERLLILPPLEGDIEDKIMLLKVETQAFPMPTSTPEEQKAFREALFSQLPAFVACLQRWKIPASIRANRYGIKHYHHPELSDALNELSPEDRLRELIDEVIFGADPQLTLWKGKAKELDRILKDAPSFPVQRESKELLPAPNSCGTYLGRLAKRYPDRFTRLPGRSGVHQWEIVRGEAEDGVNGPAAVLARRTRFTQAEAQAFIEKLKARESPISL